MSRATEYWRVNAFTDIPFAGNPAGVILDADGLSDVQLLAIARESNTISETVFVCTPRDAVASLRLRYFTSTTEVDLCGHATIAAVFALAWSGRLRGASQTRTLIVETGVGLIEVQAVFQDGVLRWAAMSQLAPAYAEAPGMQHAAAVLGLPPSAIATAPGIACSSTGNWACFVPLVSGKALGEIQIQRDQIDQLWPGNDALTGVYAFTFLPTVESSGSRQLFTQGRFFCPPRYGIVEDPVTGTASGALGGYLLQQKVMAKGEVLFARQGVEMGRPGVVRVEQGPDGRMMVGGQAVPIFRGTLIAG